MGMTNTLQMSTSFLHSDMEGIHTTPMFCKLSTAHKTP